MAVIKVPLSLTKGVKVAKGIIFLIIVCVLQGCLINTGRLVTYFGYYNESQIHHTVDLNIRLGLYWQGGSAGRGFSSPSTGSIPNRGELIGQEIVAWWKSKPYEETDSVNNINTTKYYYVRSKPGEGVQGPKRSIFSSTSYRSYISFGQLYLFESGFTPTQLSQATHRETYPSGIKLYSWGEKNKLYYRIYLERTDLNKSGREWYEIEGIEITKSQYELLEKRCNKPWYEVKCFIDQNFEGLTNSQLAYVSERTHDLDNDRLAGKIETKTKPYVNIWK